MRWRAVFWRQALLATLLLLLVWAFLNMPDQRAWQVALSAVLFVAAFVAALGMIVLNFGIEWGNAVARLVALLVLLALAGMVSGHLWSWATWLGSWLSLQRKRPVAPAEIRRWVAWALFAVQWVVIPLLLIPRGGRRWRMVPLYAMAFLAGAVAPHYLVHWAPPVRGLWPELLSAGARFFAAFALMILAWVSLGRLSRAASQP